jgi:hypothetical protein
MGRIFFATLAACAVAAGSAYAQRNSPDPVQPDYGSSISSAAQLNALTAEWDRIGFSPPSKRKRKPMATYRIGCLAVRLFRPDVSGLMSMIG